MNDRFELSFGDLTTARPPSTNDLSEVQHFRLQLFPSSRWQAQLDVIGHYQAMNVSFFVLSGSEKGKSSCLLDCKGLDPLLRAAFTSVQIELQFRGEHVHANAEVAHNRKLEIMIRALPATMLDILSLASRSQIPIYVGARCTFVLPHPPSRDTEASPKRLFRPQRYPVQGDDDDLILVFPWEGRRGIYLSAHFGSLAAASPYFARLKDALPADNALGQIHTTSYKARRHELEMLVLPHRRLTWVSPLLREDLAGELCTVQFRDLPTRHNEPDSIVRSSTYYLVVNHHSSFAYSAVLTWLRRGKVELQKLLHRGSSMAIPPEAVYRLARQLQLDDLAEVALAYYSENLSAADAIPSLFSETAAAYPELASMAISKLGLLKES